MTAIDSSDQILMEITGLGEETNEMMHVFDGRIAPGSLLVTDGKFAFETYAKNNNFNIEIVKSSRFTNEHGYSLAEVNGVHSQFDTYLKRYKGVSTRHLQGYLDLFVLAKYLGYTFSNSKDKDVYSFNNYVPKKAKMLVRDICKTPLPVDVNEAYKDFDNRPNRHYR